MASDELVTRTRLLDLMREFGLEPHRTLGQNFVVDPNTIRKIVRLAGVDPGDAVLEIGPGLGSLTLGLLAAGAEVTAVEIDERLLPALEQVTGGRARLIAADALKADWSTLLDDRPWTLVANLPYNVATPILMRLLDEVPRVSRMLIMVQREVAERLVAGPGGKDFGIPSVKVAYWATARIVGSVPADVFVPRPKVVSSLVEIVRRAEPVAAVDPDALFTLVRTAFGQRRKTLRNSLAGLVDAEQFAAAGVDPSTRPEQLGVAAWCRLAAAT